MCVTLPLGQYSKRAEGTFKLLKLLALNKQIYQSQIAETLGVSYRTLLRYLQLLQKAGLIRVARKEPSSKKGREKNVWELTFSGLLTVLSERLMPEKEVDQIAESQKDKWLIFQEWKSLTRDREVKRHIINSIHLFALKHSQIEWQNLLQLKRYATLIGNSKATKAWLNLDEQLTKREATLSSLMLDLIFSRGTVPPWIYESESEKHVLVKLWKNCVAIPNIRKFIKEQFKYEDYKHRVIKDFQKWLFKREEDVDEEV